MTFSRLFTGELAQHIPGVKTVENLRPYMTETTTETVELPLEYNYIHTKDLLAKKDKKYYRRVFDIEGRFSTIEEVTDIPENYPLNPLYYYEPASGDGSGAGTQAEPTKPTPTTTSAEVVYVTYSDGIYPEEVTFEKNQSKRTILVEHPVEIIKVINTGTVTFTTHAVGYWRDRKTLKYVPICRACEINRVFR